MRRSGIGMALSLCGVLATAFTHADVEAPEAPEAADQHVFLVRNPFGLKPPPTNAAPVAPTPPPVKLDLKLAGITHDSAGKRAWIVIPPSPARPGVPAVTNTMHLAIAEGGREGDIEVLAIDTKANTVRLLNAGLEATLDFENNGLAPPVALPGVPGARPGAPRVIPRPGAPVAIPSPANPGVKSAALNPGQFTPGSSGVGAPPVLSPTIAPNAAELATSLRTIPARSVRTIPEAPEAVDPVTQAILLRANEARAAAAGRPFPPLPPIPGAPPLQ